MRQSQQNRRSRGRGRKNQNPLSRNYESNGPDVKIRGTAAHVAEKYTALARDALSSGDPITAENYSQHAEHYNRIIMAAQVQSQTQPSVQPPAESLNGTGDPSKESADSESGKADAKASGDSAPRRRRRRPSANGAGRGKQPTESDAASKNEEVTMAGDGKSESSSGPDKSSEEIPPDGAVA